jgi:hypothetical protein
VILVPGKWEPIVTHIAAIAAASISSFEVSGKKTSRSRMRRDSKESSVKTATKPEPQITKKSADDITLLAFA